jgi:drug/metabolite transporter superfamily protein YnfA
MAAKKTPDKITTIIHSIIAIIAIIVWFYFDAGPDIFYGQYGGLFIGALCAIIASIKRRNPIVWFAFGAWFVLISLIVLFFLPRLHNRLCPYCREGVAVDASVCPHCQRDMKMDTER